MIPNVKNSFKFVMLPKLNSIKTFMKDTMFLIYYSTFNENILIQGYYTTAFYFLDIINGSKMLKFLFNLFCSTSSIIYSLQEIFVLSNI